MSPPGESRGCAASVTEEGGLTSFRLAAMACGVRAHECERGSEGRGRERWIRRGAGAEEGKGTEGGSFVATCAGGPAAPLPPLLPGLMAGWLFLVAQLGSGKDQ